MSKHLKTTGLCFDLPSQATELLGADFRSCSEKGGVTNADKAAGKVKAKPPDLLAKQREFAFVSKWLVGWRGQAVRVSAHVNYKVASTWGELQGKTITNQVWVLHHTEASRRRQ